MGCLHSLSDQKKFFGRCPYIIKELPLLFMNVLPREIYQPGAFPKPPGMLHNLPGRLTLPSYNCKGNPLIPLGV